MYSLNRKAITLKVKKPFTDWLNKNPQIVIDKDGPFTVAGLNQTPPVFLIPDESEKKLPQIIEKMKPWLFATILETWTPNQTKWPPKAEIISGFDGWFEVSVSSLLIDVCDQDILQEPLEAKLPETTEEEWEPSAEGEVVSMKEFKKKRKNPKV
jgi:hypothetical protein